MLDQSQPREIPKLGTREQFGHAVGSDIAEKYTNTLLKYSTLTGVALLDLIIWRQINPGRATCTWAETEYATPHRRIASDSQREL